MYVGALNDMVWPEAEPILLSALNTACEYAIHAKKQRWLELEKKLIDDECPFLARKYVNGVLNELKVTGTEIQKWLVDQDKKEEE
jgi:hypothetical protein